MADGVVIKITGDASDFEKKMQELSPTIKGAVSEAAKENRTGVGDIFKGIMASQIVTQTFSMITSGIRTITESAISAGKTIVDSYANYEQLVGGVETLFGAGGQSIEEYAASVGKAAADVKGEYESLIGAQEAVFERANNAYKTAGLSANAYMETITGFAASLVSSLHGDTKAAAEAADMAVIDMSDNANKMGSDISSIQNAYQGFAKQNYTMLDNLKLGYGGTKEEMERLLKDAQTISGVQYDMSSFNDIVQAIHVIQTEMGITGTTAKEAEATISGSIGMLKASFENLVSGFGNADADLGSLVNNVISAFDTVVGNITPVITTIVGKIPEAVAAVAGPLSESLSNIFDFALNNLLPQIKSIIGPVSAQLSTAFGGALDMLLDFIPSLLPDLVQGVQVLLEGVGKKLPELVKGLARMLPEFLGALGDMIPSIIEFVSQSLGAVLEGVIPEIPKIIATVVPALIKGIGAALKGVGGLAESLLVAIVPGAKNAFSTASQELYESIELTDEQKKIVGEVKADITLEAETTVNGAEKIQKEIDKLQEIVNGIPDLTPHAKANLTAAILTNSAASVLGVALESYGVNAAVADEVAGEIEDAWALIDGAIDGVGLNPEQEAELNALLENNPTKQQIEQYLTDCGVNPALAEKSAGYIKQANDTINSEIDKLGLTIDQETHLQTLVSEGATADQVHAYLESCGVNSDKAKESADKITKANGLINASVDGLGLDEQQTNHLNELIASGTATQEEIIQYLTSCGVPVDIAEGVAETITKSNTEIQTAVDGLHLDTAQSAAVLEAARSARNDLTEALDLLNLSPEQYKAAVDAVGAVSGELSSQAAQVFGDVISAFTNGAADDQEAAKEAQQKMQEWAKKAKEAVEQWYQDEFDKIMNDTSLSDIDKEGKIAELQTTAENLKSSADAIASNSGTWASELAGKSVDDVSARVQELWDMLDQVTEIENVIGMLSNEVTSYASTNRKAVEGGYETDSTRQLEAMQTTALEYENTLKDAETTRQNALEAAAQQYGDDMAAYQAAVDAIDAQYDETVQSAADTYTQHMQAILGGMMQSSPEFKELFDLKSITDQLSNAQQAIHDLYSGNLSNLNPEELTSYFDNLNIGEELRNKIMETLQGGEPIDPQTIYEALGLTPEQLEAVGNLLGGLDLADMGIEGFDFTNFKINTADFEQLVLQQLQGADIAGTIKAAIGENGNGIIIPVGDVDFTDFETALDTAINGAKEKATTGGDNIKTALSVDLTSEGTNAGKGFTNKLGTQLESAVTKARNAANEIARVMREALDIHSPSKVMQAIGQFTGEGFNIGLSESLHKATESARNIVGELNLSPKMDFAGITSSFGGAVAQLADAENARPIDVYISGKKVGGTMAPYNNSAINEYSQKIATGYGRG